MTIMVKICIINVNSFFSFQCLREQNRRDRDREQPHEGDPHGADLVCYILSFLYDLKIIIMMILMVYSCFS